LESSELFYPFVRHENIKKNMPLPKKSPLFGLLLLISKILIFIGLLTMFIFPKPGGIILICGLIGVLAYVCMVYSRYAIYFLLGSGVAGLVGWIFENSTPVVITVSAIALACVVGLFISITIGAIKLSKETVKQPKMVKMKQRYNQK